MKRNVSSCLLEVQELAYKGLVRLVLEYASPSWDPREKKIYNTNCKKYTTELLSLQVKITTLKTEV